MKKLLQFVFGLAICFGFVYVRIGPAIRASRAIQRARASAPSVRPNAPGSGRVGEPLDRIVSFSSEVTLRRDATLDIREEFTVHSAGDYFRYGLIRELPIDSEARWDRSLVGPYTKDTGIRVKILEVTEDGAPVSYEQGSDSGYPQLRIGELYTPVAFGDHRVVIHYQASGVTQFLSDHDQLYWNAVGHYWRLPVGETVVRVHLPPEVPSGVVTAAGYAGWRGATPGAPDACRSCMRGGGTPGHRGAAPVAASAIGDGFEFRAANLGVVESLSVSLTWPKGFLAPPVLGPLSHDSHLLIAPALLLLYYVIVWLALPRSPERGAVAIQYKPPQDLSPAAMRYIRTTGCDGRTLAATLAQLAARGLVGIVPQGAKYNVTRLGVDAKSLQPPLAPEELSLYGSLFDDGPAVILDPKNGGPLTRYLFHINASLQPALNNLYFTRNARWLALGSLASVITAVAMALTAHGRNSDRMTLLFLTWWFFFCFFLLGIICVMTLFPAWARLIRGLGGAREVLVGSLAVSAFGVGGAFVLWQLKSSLSLAYAFALAALVVINIAAFPALYRLTAGGRQVRDEIEGFRQFLEKVEQDRLRRYDAADPHAAESEFLPYAIALEVREPWGDHLAAACVAVTTTR